VSTRQDRERATLAGHEAERFMQNPQFVQAVEDIESDLYTQWRKSGPDDTKLREELWWSQYALDVLQKRLRKPIDEGTIAEQEQKQDNFQQRLD
jgi:hypothetical protein|tara:strand:- start:299 stop:580 length:282 start_codon:yes stop_codon:yes gene_type:complete